MRRYGLLLGVIVSASCSQSYSLDGTWNVGGAEVSWPGSTAQITFSSSEGSDSGLITMVMEGPQYANGLSWVQTYKCEGTFSLNGDRLAMTYKDVEASVKGMDPETEKVYLELVSQMEAEILAGLNSQPPGEIRWKDRDTFEYRTDVVATMRRVTEP